MTDEKWAKLASVISMFADLKQKRAALMVELHEILKDEINDGEKAWKILLEIL